MLRYVSPVLMCVGVILIGVGGWMVVRDELSSTTTELPAADQHLVTLVETERTFAETVAGNEYPFTLRIDNRTGKPARVHGILETCGAVTCIRCVKKAPFDLEPGMNEVPCALKVRHHGEFEIPIELYAADNGVMRILRFTARGTAKPGETEKTK